MRYLDNGMNALGSNGDVFKIENTLLPYDENSNRKVFSHRLNLEIKIKSRSNIVMFNHSSFRKYEHRGLMKFYKFFILSTEGSTIGSTHVPNNELYKGVKKRRFIQQTLLFL